jgi:hypothetical protein
MKTRKEKYKNTRTGQIKEFEVEVDKTNHIPMYQCEDRNEWKAMPKWTLNVVNSSEFFAASHEPRVKFTRPPLEGSDMPYGIT